MRAINRQLFHDKLHPLAWAVWLACVSVYAFMVTNPLCTLLALGAVLLVHVGRPRESSGPVRGLIVLGLVLLVIRIVFWGLMVNPGRTTLIVLPRLALPTWLGGFSMGGRITAEVLAEAFGEGLRLILVLAAFGVFNAAADLPALLRAVPSGFRDAGLVTSISLAFVPGLLSTARDVRDAQILRGERGLRSLAPSLAVPVLGLSLERAFLLAESMDERGYGSGGNARARSNVVIVSALAAGVAGVALWVSGLRPPATALVLAAAVTLLWSLRSLARSSGETRMRRPGWSALDAIVMAAAALALAAGHGQSFAAFPVIHWPTFSVWAGAATLLFAAPLLEPAK